MNLNATKSPFRHCKVSVRKQYTKKVNHGLRIFKITLLALNVGIKNQTHARINILPQSGEGASAEVIRQL